MIGDFLEFFNLMCRFAFYFLASLWSMQASLFSEYIEGMANEYVDNVTRILFEAFDTHYISAKHLKPGGDLEAYSWTYTTAIFFTATLLTTIGYGNLTPVKFKSYFSKLA